MMAARPELPSLPLSWAACGVCRTRRPHKHLHEDNRDPSPLSREERVRCRVKKHEDLGPFRILFTSEGRRCSPLLFLWTVSEFLTLSRPSAAGPVIEVASQKEQASSTLSKGESFNLSVKHQDKLQVFCLTLFWIWRSRWGSQKTKVEHWNVIFYFSCHIVQPDLQTDDP